MSNLKQSGITYILCAAIAAAIALFIVFIQDEKEVKFARMSKVFAESNIKQTYEKELKTFEEESNAKLEELQNVIKRREMDGESSDVLNPLRVELNGMQSRLTEQYNQKSEAFQNSIWQELNKRIEEYGKKMGYKYILGANGDGSIMYGDEAEDITEELIKYLNK